MEQSPRVGSSTARGRRQRPWSAMGKFRSSGSSSPVAPAAAVAVLHKHQKHISRPSPSDPRSTFLDREIGAVIQGQYVDDHTRSMCPACTSLHAERCNYCLRGKSSTAPRMHLHELGQLLIQQAAKGGGDKKGKKNPTTRQQEQAFAAAAAAAAATTTTAATGGLSPSPRRPPSPLSPKSPKQPEVASPGSLTPESLLQTLVLYGRSSKFALEMNEKLNWPNRSSMAVHQQGRQWCVKHYDQYSDVAEYTAGLEMERGHNNDILRKSRKKLIAKNGELSEALARLKALDGALAEERKNNAELQQQNDDLCKYLDRAARDKLRITELEQMNAKLKNELNAKLQELEALFEKGSEPSPEHIAEVKGLHSEIKVLKAENVELRAKNESTRNELEASRLEFDELRGAGPCSMCDGLRREVDLLQGELAALRAKLTAQGAPAEKRPATAPKKAPKEPKKRDKKKGDSTDNDLDARCRASKQLCPLGKLLPKNAEKKPAPVPPKSCLKEIYEILEKKVLADIADEKGGTTSDTLPEFLDDYFQHKYGLKKMADEKVKAFLQSLVRHNADIQKLEAKGSEEKLNRRFSFVLDALGLRNERLWSRESSELYCLLLRRAFHANLQG